jgi:hypothetical protein
MKMAEYAEGAGGCKSCMPKDVEPVGWPRGYLDLYLLGLRALQRDRANTPSLPTSIETDYVAASENIWNVKTL